MPCLCTTNTLRLFIHSVTHIDLSATAPRIASTQLRKGAARNFTTTQAASVQSSFHQRFDTAISSTSSPTEFPNAERSSRPEPTSTKSNQWSQKFTAGKHAPLSSGHDVDLDSVIAEFSPETINALVAESLPETPGSDRESQHEGGAWGSRRDTGSWRTAPGEPRFRRTKVQNTSLAIHFSSPRAPVSNSLSDTSQVSSLNRSEVRPDYREYRQELGESRSENWGRGPRDSAKNQARNDWTPPPRENWMLQKAALKEKVEGSWNPMKRLSPDALAGIRALHAQMPEIYTTATLAENFKVSPEAIRRILKSKWTPKQEEEIDRQKRWFKRGEKVWDRWATEGKKPPNRWRQHGRGQWKRVVRDGRETKQWIPAAAVAEASPRRPEISLGTRGRDAPVTMKPDTIPWG